MKRHPIFPRLQIFEDAELAESLGSQVVDRQLVHEWPLTRTEKVVLADGATWAVKTQLQPTVEVDFYASARTTLLPPHRRLAATQHVEALATEWIDAPTLSSLQLSEVLERAREVSDAIAAIEGLPPVHLDISTPTVWTGVAADCQRRVLSAIDAGHFPRVKPSLAGQIHRWAMRPEIVHAATSRPGLVHGDLTPQEVFLSDDGLRVVDWQRPLRGPRELDLVSLLTHSGIDPADHVDSAVVALSHFLLLHWSVVALDHVRPHGPAGPPQEWAISSLRKMFA